MLGVIYRKTILTVHDKQKGKTHLPCVKSDIGGHQKVKLNKTYTLRTYLIYHMVKQKPPFTPRISLTQ